MKLVLTPSKILTEKAKPVTKIDNRIRKIISEMKDVLNKSQIGVGLAASQVGLPLRLFIAAPTLIKRANRPVNPYKIFINPQLVPIPENQQLTTNNRLPKTTLEGCLSIPNVWGRVMRSPRVTLSYLDETGASHTDTFTGFMAIIVQHEMDHLAGTLFTQHVISQKEKLYKQVKDEETGKMVMEEIEL